MPTVSYRGKLRGFGADVYTAGKGCFCPFVGIVYIKLNGAGGWGWEWVSCGMNFWLIRDRLGGDSWSAGDGWLEGV